MERRARIVGVASLVAVAGFVACGAPSDPSYGPVDGISRVTVPPPPGYNPGGTTGGSTGDGGSSPGCSPAGYVDGGTCATSWKRDIYTKMTDPAGWKCATSGCHGGSTAPAISPQDSSAAWTSLSAFVTSVKKPYINPCSANPADSAIVANLQQVTGGGSPMPPTGPKLTDADIATVQAWVQCGAPNN